MINTIKELIKTHSRKNRYTKKRWLAEMDEEDLDKLIHAVTELEKQNAELVKERDELNKQCGEFQDGFFEYMGLSDHLQIEVDNLKKKVVNLTTPDTSEKLGVDS